MKHLTNMTVLIFLVLPIKLFSHCQVPCGIYDDAARIIQIKEDFGTIKKAKSIPIINGKRTRISKFFIPDIIS